MKPMKRTTRFVRHYKERIARSQLLRSEFLEAVAVFLDAPANVNDHALKGRISHDRAFAINGDYRVIYIEKPDHYLFKDIGTHEQVYIR